MNKEEIKKREARVGIQMEKIYQLVEKRVEVDEIRKEYEVYIKKLADLYSLFFEKIERQKKQKEITLTQSQKKKDALVKQYRKELLDFAVAIDQALGLE